MAEFKLGRIRFVWKGAWSATTQYYIDDVIRYGGRTYICAVGHISASDFNTDLEYNPTKWNQMSDGQEWKGDWSTTTLYKINDVVKYGGQLYICNDSHTSAATTTLGLETDQAKWTLYAEGFDWKGDWSVSTRYKINDIVKYGGQTYVCNMGHTSDSSSTNGLELDQAKWDYFNKGFEFKGNWTTSTRYKVNDVVKNGGSLWICILHHTAGTFSTDAATKWSLFVEGFEFENTWSSATDYQPGDVVAYGGNQYVSKSLHTNLNPTTNSSDWDLFAEGLKFQSDWINNISYKIGEVVRLNGYTYLCVLDSPTFAQTVTGSSAGNNRFTCSDTTGFVVGMTVKFTGTVFGNVNLGATYYIKTVNSSTEFTISTVSGGTTFVPTTAGGSMTATVSAAPPFATYWTRLNSGVTWQGSWTDDTEYQLGDAVRFGANAYICILTHRSEGDDGSTIGVQGGGAANSRPDLDSSGTYWNVLSIGTETSVLTTRGDLVFYGGAGPTRLPVGLEGQVLRSTGTDPEWRTLGLVEGVYYVAPNGVDLPFPIHGGTLDKPWKTIRYACEQVEKGPKNPNAQRLLEMNRAFIQKEVSAWIRHQITNNIAPFTPAFDYDEYKCERDVGFIVDRLIHDVGHGGNLKMRAAAQSFVGAFGEEGEFSASQENQPYATLAAEADEGIAAYNYMLDVVEAVLNNEVPATVYQNVTDDSTAIVAQYIDTDYTSETGVMSRITNLVGIVTQALEDQDSTNIPARDVPNNLINVKSGRYRETLPIIVPAETCILGDEVRSTNAGPAGSLINRDDAKYSIGALGRLETIVGQIILGSNVTESTGNTEIQDIAVPFASAPEVTYLQRLVRMMQHRIDWKLQTMHMATYTDPTGYDASYLIGYGDARTLIRENKEFIKSEIVAYITDTYPSLKYSKTACKRDVGFIVDALIYDLTYNGSTQTLNAALAYFDGPGSSLMINSTELAATIAAYQRLKAVVQDITQNNVIIKSTTNTATQWTDATNLTSGNNANTFIGNNIDIIINILNAASTTARPNITVTTITGSNTLATASAHGLAAGDLVVPRTTANGVTADTRYYVLASGLTGTQFQISTSFAGAAATVTNGSGLTIVFDTEDRPAATNGVTTTTALITAYTTLSAAVGTIVTNMTTYITNNFPNITYNSAKCQRDARIILDAVGYDFMFNSNVQTIAAAYSYLRQSAYDVFEDDTKEATRAAFTYVKDQAKSNVGGDATAQARIESLMTTLDDIIYGATDEGQVCQTSIRTADYARLQLERNRSYIVAEIDAWIDTTYSGTVTATAAVTGYITIGSTSWLQRNAAVRFSGTLVGGLNANTTYYVQNIISSTQFTVATTRNATTPFITTTATGSFTVKLHYNSETCLRDVNTYIDALKWDIQWTSNYKSRYAARYYYNAVTGSLEEDMYYLRNGTGVRNQTLEGLQGDLTPENAYGTRRVTAGAYCSLDPGWGPDDFRTWIIARSPYVQNVCTFGYAAIGQKIDGALHNGGNDSIVSNDFTQVISDGIGAWVTNNGRAELVSVFTYYSHIGYLSEAGGRIRGTNGNNSYGDFGSVAEGFDATETPGTGIVDNRNFEAVVGEVYTDGAQNIYRFEFDNAGNEYNQATWTVSGAGSGAQVEQDEFRDGAVFEVHLLDNVDDSTNAPEAAGNFGGFGYLTNSNTAQGGTTSQITIAATDGELSTAYIGMKIYLTGGTGVGQFGIIATYNAGTKVATVTKESTGGAGWDHVVMGTTIVAPDASTTYTIEPRVSFSAPAFARVTNVLPTSGTWAATVYGDTTATYTGLTGTYSGSGSGATWQVIRDGKKYYVTNVTPGINYTRLQTITIVGTSLGGATTENDLVITITAVNSSTGAIQAFDFTGYGIGGRFVASRTSSATGATSEDGDIWDTRVGLFPSSGSNNWGILAAGMFTDGSTLYRQSRFVAIQTTAANTSAAYSDDGITWSASSMVTSATWVGCAFGENKFVAISSTSTVVRISADGILWDATGTLNSTGWTAIAYGMGRWVCVKTGTNSACWSTDGVTWTDVTLPATSAWTKVTWGNGRFVAISSTAGSTVVAFSLDGATWSNTGAALPTSATWQSIAYGQGVFLAVSTTTAGATSEDGINWTARTLLVGTGYQGLSHGNPSYNPRFVGVGIASGTDALRLVTGATTKARAYVASEKIYSIKITEPGSYYLMAPTMTITDPNNTFEAPSTVRVGDGVLANPSFKSRGTGYVSAAAEILTGDGYGDYFQSGQYISVKRLTKFPVAGSNVTFGHLPGQTFKLVNVLTQLGTFAGDYSAFFQIAPEMKLFSAPTNAESVTTRIRYSQVRLTGHDFLDIGTGNFDETNYPNGVPENLPNQANETVDNNGGRVFYTSTDQDGNFRVGELFTIEQSTGIATLNADAFNIAGLQELTLGEVSLGGGSASITEFSTDPFFTANSDSVVPTQRAIKAYIASQIGGGGASLNVNSVTAGFIYIASNQISTTTGSVIQMKAKFEFRGGVTGLPIAWNYFLT